MVVALAVAPAVGLAQPDNWINPVGGDWNHGSNWSTGAPPVPYQPAQISLGAITPYPITVTSVAGQKSCLTLENGTILGDDPIRLAVWEALPG